MRKCTKCKEAMLEGFVIEGGQYYYCSRECLEIELSWEYYLELYDEGEGDSYYTEWELEEEDEHEQIEYL